MSKRQSPSYQGGGSRRIVELDFAALAKIISMQELPEWAQRELTMAASRATVAYSEVAIPREFEKAAKILRSLVEKPATAARLGPILEGGEHGELSPFDMVFSRIDGLGKHVDAGLSQRDRLIGSCLIVLEGLGIKRPGNDNDLGKFTEAHNFVIAVLKSAAHTLPRTDKATMRLINSVESRRNSPEI